MSQNQEDIKQLARETAHGLDMLLSRMHDAVTRQSAIESVILSALRTADKEAVERTRREDIQLLVCGCREKGEPGFLDVNPNCSVHNKNPKAVPMTARECDCYTRIKHQWLHGNNKTASELFDLHAAHCVEHATKELRQEIEQLKVDIECERGVRQMAVDRLGGVVEGQPTHTGNFLQRIDELRETEVIWERCKPEYAEQLTKQMELRQQAERDLTAAREALRKIRDESADLCACTDHADSDCCNQVGEYCPHCLADAALTPPAGGDKETNTK